MHNWERNSIKAVIVVKKYVVTRKLPDINRSHTMSNNCERTKKNGIV